MCTTIHSNLATLDCANKESVSGLLGRQIPCLTAVSTCILAYRSSSWTGFQYCWSLTGELLLICVVSRSYCKCFSFKIISDLQVTTFLLNSKVTRCKTRIWHVRKPAESRNTFYCFMQSFPPFLSPPRAQYNNPLMLSVLPWIWVFSVYPVASCVRHFVTT